jgi:excisionase family DNA binding protein
MSEIDDLATHCEKWVTVADLAEYWNVSRRTIERDIAKGALPVTRVGSGENIRISIIDARKYGKPNGSPEREAAAEADRQAAAKAAVPVRR